MTRTAYQKMIYKLPSMELNEKMETIPIQMQAFDYRTVALENVTN